MAVFNVIDHQEFSSATTEWAKTSIPGSYDHLLVKASTRSTRTGADYGAFTIKLNHVSSPSIASYNVITMDTSTQSGVTSGDADGYTSEFQGGWQPAGDAAANTFSAVTIWIPNYSQADYYKQVLVRQCFPNTSGSDDEWQVSTRACLFRFNGTDTRAITTVAMRRYYNDFAQYSSFTLYGITAY